MALQVVEYTEELWAKGHLQLWGPRWALYLLDTAHGTNSALGAQITPESSPGAEGTGGFSQETVGDAVLPAWRWECEAAPDLCPLPVPGGIPEALAENAGVNKPSHKAVA